MGGRTPVPWFLPYRFRLQFREGPDDQHQHHSQQHEQPSDRRGGRSRRSLSPAQREQADAARAARIAALYEQIGEQVEALTADPQWRAMLDAAAKFHTYSLNNQLLIELQAARLGISPTRVAGFGTWKALGRSVVKGSTGLAVLAPLHLHVQGRRHWHRAGRRPGRTRRHDGDGDDGGAGRACTPTGRPAVARVLRGFRIAQSSTSPRPTVTRCPTSHPSCLPMTPPPPCGTPWPPRSPATATTSPARACGRGQRPHRPASHCLRGDAVGGDPVERPAAEVAARGRRRTPARTHRRRARAIV
jgi:hypothetical protein